jgi:hypothetical protein
VCRYGILRFIAQLLGIIFFFKTILLNQNFFYAYVKQNIFFVANAVTDYLISFPSKSFIRKKP